MARATPRKDQLVEIAVKLFNERGYHQVGIDTIMEASGVSKTTLYKYYRSKEDLVLEILNQRSLNTLHAMRSSIEATKAHNKNASPLKLVEGIVAVITSWIESDVFCGCNFIRAVLEYETENTTVAQRAKQHKEDVKSLIATVLTGPAKKKAEQAEKIMLIIDGAIIAAHVREREDASQNARALIKMLLA